MKLAVDYKPVADLRGRPWKNGTDCTPRSDDKNEEEEEEISVYEEGHGIDALAALY